MLARIALLGSLAAAIAGCGGGTGGSGAGATTDTTASVSPATVPTDTPTIEGAPDAGCLVAGSPWKLNVRDLERQFPTLFSGINVTNVQIGGGQTLVVKPDLHASLKDNMTITFQANLSAGVLKMVQQHSGGASGQWRARGNKLIPTAQWEGEIRGTSKATVNGRTSQVPIKVPKSSLVDRPITYTCANGTLEMTVPEAPISYVFKAS